MKYLVIGGAGFTGINFCKNLLDKKQDVIIFDNLSRKGAIENINWLKELYGKKFRLEVGDIRYDLARLKDLMEEVDVVHHFAGQVAVTTSVKDPMEDFQTNAFGTLNILEAIRFSEKKPILLYSSTNKVYGGMSDLTFVKRKERYEYQNLKEGVSEARQLDFHSPYGCSKGSADQYIQDYSRIYGLKVVILRQSCIYGPRQFGIEDQGWVAWFTIASVLGKPITIFGDGRQVRDVLHVDDLFELWELAVEKIDEVSGQVFNIGGGPKYSLSLIELLKILEENLGRKIKFSFSDWRPGDQRVYISNISKAKEVLGWEPKITVEEGVTDLIKWVRENKHLFE